MQQPHAVPRYERFARFAVLGLFACILLALPVTAAAHPLGNFTVNRYSRLEVEPTGVHIRYVLDMAEIPTYQLLATVHVGEGKPTDQERQSLLASQLTQLVSHLALTVDGKRVQLALDPGKADLEFPEGQGGLPTMRISTWITGQFPDATDTTSRSIAYQDDNFAERLGWKEIVVRGGSGVGIQGAVTATDQSNELRSYPQDMLSSPLDVRGVRFSLAPGTGATSGEGSLLQPRGKTTGLIQWATDSFTGLVTQRDLTAPFILFALIASAALGAVHALSPGHGKTVVAAYLVGARGTAKHAVILGITVTVTHTAGVFALGLLTLFASHWILPERLFPWLSTISGLLVAIIGGWLLVVRLQAARLRPASVAATPLAGLDVVASTHQDHDHAHGHEYHHDHDHDHDHSHPHGHDHHHNHDTQAVAHSHDHGLSQLVENDGHSHGHGDIAPVGHDHGTGWHTHAVPTGPVSMRGLLALGVSGGLLPCPSALVVLLAAISLQRTSFGMVLVVAFSIGLAGALTAIGLLLVYARGVFSRFRLEAGLGRFLPVASALVVFLIGMAMTIQALLQTGIIAL